MKNKLVIGAGAWGTAIANLIATNYHDVLLLANKQEIIDEVSQKNTNHKFLPDIILSNKIKAVEDLFIAIKNCDLVFIATPSDGVMEVFSQIFQMEIDTKTSFVICSKGLDSVSLKFFSQIFKETFPQNNLAILSGPTFAIEVANQASTVATVASDNQAFAQEVIKILNNNFFRAKYSSSPISAEVCGVVKNIMAIGCGIIDGFNLGQNPKAALVNKGIEEILLLCKALDSSPDISSPAGFGDIFLTCSSSKSRNNSLGVMIAQGKHYKDIVQETKKTFEGANSAKSIANLAKMLKIELILCKTIAEILDSNYSSPQIKTLITKAIF